MQLTERYIIGRGLLLHQPEDWHRLPEVNPAMLVGQLYPDRTTNLTQRVQSWERYVPEIFLYLFQSCHFPGVIWVLM